MVCLKCSLVGSWRNLDAYLPYREDPNCSLAKAPTSDFIFLGVGRLDGRCFVRNLTRRGVASTFLKDQVNDLKSSKLRTLDLQVFRSVG